MKNRAISFIRQALLLLLLASLCHAAPLAMLTGVRGPVSIMRGGKTLPAQTGAPLQAGDVVRVGAGGAATIYFAKRAPQTLGANQQMKIAANGKASAPSLWSSVYNGVSAGFARRGEKVGATVRNARPDFAVEQIAPLSPVNSRVTGRPTLFWALADAPANGDFQVQLLNAEGEELWRIATPQTRLEVPSVPMQNGAKYFWIVTPRGRDAQGKLTPIEEKRSTPVWFEIASPVLANSVRRDLNAIAVALKSAPENTRRAAQSAVLAERRPYAGAIAAPAAVPVVKAHECPVRRELVGLEGPLGRVPDDQRGVVAVQEAVDVRGEPARVAELEAVTCRRQGG